MKIIHFHATSLEPKKPRILAKLKLM